MEPPTRRDPPRAGIANPNAIFHVHRLPRLHTPIEAAVNEGPIVRVEGDAICTTLPGALLAEPISTVLCAGVGVGGGSSTRTGLSGGGVSREREEQPHAPRQITLGEV